MKALLSLFIFISVVAAPVLAADTSAPTSPQDLIAVRATATSITLQWTASTDDTGVTAYEVFRDGVSQATVTTTTYVVSGLTSGVSYQFTVRARDAAGNWSYLSAPQNYYAAGAWGVTVSGSIYSQDDYDGDGNWIDSWITSDYYSYGVSQPGTITATLNGFSGASLAMFTGGAFYNNQTYTSDAGDGSGFIAFSTHTADIPGYVNVGVYSGDGWSTGAYNLSISFQPDTQSPYPYFDSGALPATAPLSVNFDASASVASTGSTITAYSWDFQNDGVVDASGATANYTYSSSNNYGYSYFIARLKVTGSNGVAAYTVRKLVDLTPPAAPANPRVIEYGNNYFTISCDASSDNVQTVRYGVYNSSGGLIAMCWSLGAPLITLYSWNAVPPCTLTMRAFDQGGNVSAASQVLSVPVPSAPSFTSQPQSQSVAGGQNATFTPGISGSTLTFQWRKDGAIIFGATGSQLNISNAQAADGGSYTLTARNYLGSVTSNAATLTVNAPPAAPSITTQPISQTVTEGNMKTVSTGAINSIAITNTGTVSGWGDNSYGQLGDGTTNSHLTPAASLLTGAVSIAAGHVHTIGLKSDGSIWAFGEGYYGTLGNNGATNSSVPVPVSTATGLTSAGVVIAGQRSSWAIKTDGTVWGWGSNYYGQLGNGTTAIVYQPARAGSLTDIVAISGSYTHALALQRNGTVWGWGNNDSGQLGDGTTTSSATPVVVNTPPGVIGIAAASGYSIALTADGKVWTWGAAGQLGDGTAVKRLIPGFIGLDNVRSIAVSSYNTRSYAVKNDGTLWGWNGNGGGVTDLGDGTEVPRSTPVQIGTTMNLADINTVTADGYFGLTMKTDGTIWPWGTGSSGQLGNNTTSSRSYPALLTGATARTPAIIGGTTVFTVVANGSPVPAYQWQRRAAGGTSFINLAEDINYYGTSTQRLRVNGITGAMNGDQFRCIVTNASGVVTSGIANLTVGYAAPYITSQPVNVFKQTSENTQFQVSVAAFPTPTYQWKKNGVVLSNGGNVSGANTATLAISNVQSADAAAYTVVVSNAYGQVTSAPATIAIGTPPIFTVQPHPQPQTLTAGQQFTLSASATGSATIAYQWMLGGFPVLNATTDTMTIPVITPGFAGSWTLVATNSWGSQTSNAAGLTVLPLSAPTVSPATSVSPTSFTANWSAVTAATNYRVDVSTRIDFATFVSTYENIFVSGATALAVTGLSGNTAYYYRVRAENAAGPSAASGAISVTTSPPEVAPSITIQPTNQSAMAGGNAIMSVTAAGNPAPTYQWQVSTNGLAGASGNWANCPNNNTTYAYANTNALAILFTTIGENNYRYRCIVTNVVQGVTQNIYSNEAVLTVNYAPVFTSQPADRAVPAWSSTAFSAAASGNPSPSYQWWVSTNGGGPSGNWVALSNGSIYSGVNSPTLNINATSAVMDNYRYRCVATNTIQSVDYTATSNEARLTLNNASPVGSIIGSTTLLVGQVGTWAYSATDANGNLKSWRVSLLPAQANAQSISGTSATGAFSFGFDTPGTKTWELYVEDWSGATNTSTVQVTVGSAPTVLPYTASGSGGANDVLDYGGLTDGIHSNGLGYGSAYPYNSWLKADLGSLKFISNVYVGGGYITNWDDAANFSAGTLLQSSNDTINWSTVYTFTGAFSSSGTVATVNQAARYWRIYRNDWLGTTEFRLEGGGAAAAPAITSSLTTSGTANTAFSYTIVATNSPTSFSAVGLPTGLSLNAGTGVISGTPTVSGSFNVLLAAANSYAVSTVVTLAITIAPGAGGAVPVITSGLTGSTSVNANFTYQITASGSPTSYGATGLPAGLAVNATTGVISGFATATGSFNVTLSAANAAGAATPATLVLAVNAAPTITRQPISQTAPAGATVVFTVTASGYPAPTIQWQKNGSNLSNSGNVSGATTNTLTLANIQSSDVATYTAIATNTNSVTSNGASLTLGAMDPNADYDGDGVTNGVELSLGLNPYDPSDVNVQLFQYDKVNQLKRGPGGEYIKDAEGNIRGVNP